MEGASRLVLLLLILLIFLKIHALELQTISSSQFLTDGDTLVSQTGVFRLGFFQPGKSNNNKYLGIMYNKVSVTTVVWVANRNHPITGNSSPPVLKIEHPGILVLYDNLTIIWSSKTKTTSANVYVTAKLLDTGNLVLMDKNKKIVWQSFDYPTDTLLPGMKLGSDYMNGIEWCLSSWRNNEDPSVGEFTWGADTHHYPESKLRQGAVVKFRGMPWKNQRITGVSQFDRHLVVMYSVVVNKSEVSFSYNKNNNSMLGRLAVNSSGQLESSVWVEDGKKWQLVFSLPMDVCDTYNVCSAYGICSLNKVQQSCGCLDEKRFVPRNRRSWEAGDWSGGCVRRTPLDCRSGSDGFVKYSVVKLPDTESSGFNMSMSLEECGLECLKNCKCMGYANPDTSVQGGACLLWFSDLIDIGAYSVGYGDQDIFVRMASSELVDQLISKKKRRSHIKIILSVTGTGILVGIISTWAWYARINRRHGKPRKEESSMHILKDNEEDVQLPIFTFSTIARATSSFLTENKLGEGGFGPVFKGVLEDGKEIAVKRLSATSRQGVDEFMNEVICISKLQHRNLVKLLGCCIQEDEKLLVYEFMPNKSLDNFIFDEKKSILLDWRKRYDIIKGIARGLQYLHHDSRLRIIHRDLKAGNILLDANMNPKISDFGLARSFGDNETHANTQRVVGTYGYMSPEYARDGLFSIKSDVFSFGVLVLEIVSGKKNRGFIHPEHDNNLIGHAWSIYKEGRSMELLDVSLLASCHPLEVLRVIQVGLLCVQQSAEHRPNMSSVIMMLVDEGALRKPNPPAFFMGRDPLISELSYEVNQPSCSINDISITKLDAR